VICNYQIKFPEGAQAKDELLVQIINHSNSDVFVTIGAQGSSLSARNKEFVIKNKQRGVKEFKLTYPKTLYLGIEPINKNFVDLLISY
jgi:hypothetical protein